MYFRKDGPMKKITKANVTLAAALLALFSLALISAQARTHNKHKKGDFVYVCACLKTKSCPCMSEAKTEGPCACGTHGGPPMQRVASDSNWAKQNRDTLAQ
jgi:hypothetical protein